MRPARPVYIAAQAITPFIGKGNPHFIAPGHPEYGKRDNPTLEEHLCTVVRKLLDDHGIDPSLIQRGFVGNFAGELFSKQGHLGAMVARADARLASKGFTRVEAACASGGVGLVGAIEAIQAGFDVVLVVGAEVQTTVRAREGADYLARAAHYATERPIDDFTFPALLARRAKAYKETYGLTDRDLAHFTVKAYSNANRNPLAHMHAVKITLEQAATAGDHNPQILQNPELKPHLKVSDCSQVSDGAAAVLLASEAGLQKLGRRKADCVQVRAYGFCTNPLGQVQNLLRFDTTAAAVAEALRDAGCTPQDVQVAEVHDCFTIAELLMYEAIGWAEQGKGIELLLSGRTSLEGDLPVNTGGGLLGFGHPVGATGVKQAAEIYRQMKGLCGDYQIPRELHTGLTVNMGGDDRTVVALVLENCTV
ncbi:MAG: acetyl-CoA acetyltransferase [Candidatus Tectimicrobiota bacterium]|nr:MAG: acetyl-CoA acetyltransferase [Candidatus Tectomicrobia bacterium]